MAATLDFQSDFLAVFISQVTLMLSTTIQVNLPIGSGEEAKNKFSRWALAQLSWISNWNDFSFY